MSTINLQRSIEQSQRIWAQGAEEAKDSYWRFRRTFECPACSTVPMELAIAADTDFEVWMNGNRLPGTQYQAYPEKRFYTVFKQVEQFLLPGINCISVLVYHLGVPNATHSLAPGGLMLALTDGCWQLFSDAVWKVSPATAYVSGQCKNMTFPVGMRFEYHAENEEAWHATAFDDQKWDHAVVLPRPAENGSWSEMAPRPVPVCDELSPAPVKLIWQGEFQKPSVSEINPDKFKISPDEPKEPFLRHRHPELAVVGYSDSWNCGDETYPIALGYDTPAMEILPPDGGVDGISLIFDCGRECAGFLELDWECDEQGVTMEIHHGEHLDDCRIRSRILYARYIDTIHLGTGRHHLRHTMRRIGARYLQLFFSGMTRSLKLHYAGLAEQILPVPEAAKIKSPDAAELRLQSLSARTLQLCMHEHYEDCPWREQSLYAGDSRIQMLCGYYVWGNYDFAAASLELLAMRYFDDCGYLSLCAPSGDKMTIASYSFIWIAAVRELVLFSGKIDFFTKPLIRQRVCQILERALNRPLETLPGLYRAASDEQLFRLDTGGRVWNFYEWCGELSCDNRLEQSLYQAYLSEALNAAADLNRWAGFSDEAEKLQQAADLLLQKTQQLFWDDNHGCYTAFLPDTKQDYYEHVQSMMLLNAAKLPMDRREKVYNALQSRSLRPCTWYNWYYLAKAMVGGNAATRKTLFQRYHAEFDRFAFNASTSLWEVSGGGNAGRFGGSLCHGWTAIPAWFAGALKLGVTPLEPGFSKFEVKPAFLDLCNDLDGEVPTPHGPITVSIHNRKVQFTEPSGTEGAFVEQSHPFG